MTSAQTWDLSYQPADLLPGASLARSNGAEPGNGQPGIGQLGNGLSAGQHCRLVLRPVLESAKVARDFTKATLRDWQLDGLACEAVTIASELVTNAIRHGVGLAAAADHDHDSAGVGLTWQREPSRVVCVVTDQSAKPPVLAASGPDAESGRGLQVVQALAAAWGWMMLSAQEKAVWAALLLPVSAV